VHVPVVVAPGAVCCHTAFWKVSPVHAGTVRVHGFVTPCHTPFSSQKRIGLPSKPLTQVPSPDWPARVDGQVALSAVDVGQ